MPDLAEKIAAALFDSHQQLRVSYLDAAETIREVIKANRRKPKPEESRALLTRMRVAWEKAYGHEPTWPKGKCIAFHKARNVGLAGQLTDDAIYVAWQGPYLHNEWHWENKVVHSLEGFFSRFDHWLNQITREEGDYR